MKTNTKIALSAGVLGLVTAFASLIISPPASWDYTVGAFHFSLSTNILAFFLHVGAATLLVLSLNVYKQDLRKAFSGIVFGLVLIALGTFQLPFLDVFDLWNSAYVTNGIVGLPFLVGGLMSYFGAAAFGRLVDNRSPLTNKFVAIPITLLLATASTLLPHVPTPVEEIAYDAGNFVIAWTMLLLIAAAFIFFGIRKKIGEHYTRAIFWTGLALILSGSCILVAFFDTLVSTATRDPITEFLNLLTIVSGLIWLKAGYTFTNTKEY